MNKEDQQNEENACRVSTASVPKLDLGSFSSSPVMGERESVDLSLLASKSDEKKKRILTPLIDGNHRHRATEIGHEIGTSTLKSDKQVRRLKVVLVLVSTFFLVEFFGAIKANSSALRADALHLLMDIAALILSLSAMKISLNKSNAKYTFGYLRAEPMAALVNGFLVLGTGFEIVREAIESFIAKSQPKGLLMLQIAFFALLVNSTSAWLIHSSMRHEDVPHSSEGHQHQHDHEHNMRGALLHLLGDALGAFAAIVAALVIKGGGPPQVDPIASVVVAGILFVGAYRLLRDTFGILMEATPKRFHDRDLSPEIMKIPGVIAVSKYRVWTVGSGADAMMLHVQVKEGTRAFMIAERAKIEFKLKYVTVQIDEVYEAKAA